MTEEIKRRIDTIGDGKVPKGYKQTQFGIFPAEWVTDKVLGEIGTFGKGKGIPGTMLGAGNVPCVGYGDIYMKYNHFHFEKAQSFVDEKTAQESISIEKGTLLFTATGETAEEIGKCVCYNGDETIYAGGDIITFNSQTVNPMFLAYQQYQDFSLKRKARLGQGHSVVHIHKENLDNLPVAFPHSPDEQQKISAILLKWDKAIELQEQLVDKLEFQKKALMQKLLVPKDNWKKTKLGDICNISTGKLDANAMVVDGKYPFFTCSKQIYKIDKYAFDCEALLISGNGDIGDIKYYNGKFNAYQRTYVLNKFTIPIKYVMFYLEKNFQKSICLGTQKSSMPYIKLETLLNANIYYDPAKVQKTIKFFEMIDLKLELHKRKLQNLQQQQRAMQQLLLTGIIRV